jgi:TRAP-type C4-dicarboxylate transport system permease small subunit
MKYLLTILTVFSALLTLGFFILFVWGGLALLLGGGFNVVLPGLGLVISGGLIVFALFILSGIMAAVTILLARKVFKRLP